MTLPSSQPLVSTLIPTRNRPDLLDAALASVAAQDLAHRVEAIVVNDGGQSVAPVVRPWTAELAVRLVELDGSVGPAAARNAAIDLADGRYLAFLDDDDLFLPGHLAAGCTTLERGEADLVYAGAVVADRRLRDLPASLVGFPLKAYPYHEQALQVVNYLHTGSVIVRSFREMPVRFDESLDVCEDWDLWLALTTVLGYRAQFVDKITSIYHQLPDLPGMVAGAQLVSPSKFSLARDYLHKKWPSEDPLVLAHREWMVALEHLRSDLIAQGERMPNLLFDRVLSYVHDRMYHGEAADYDIMSSFFLHG